MPRAHAASTAYIYMRLCKCMVYACVGSNYMYNHIWAAGLLTLLNQTATQCNRAACRKGGRPAHFAEPGCCPRNRAACRKLVNSIVTFLVVVCFGFFVLVRPLQVSTHATRHAAASLVRCHTLAVCIPIFSEVCTPTTAPVSPR